MFSGENGSFRLFYFVVFGSFRQMFVFFPVGDRWHVLSGYPPSLLSVLLAYAAWLKGKPEKMSGFLWGDALKFRLYVVTLLPRIKS